MYKKTLIRQYFTALLKAGVTSVNNRVYSGRINPKEDENYPYLTVFTKDENITEQFTSHTSRELELHIGVIVKDNTIKDGDFFEVVENIMYDVESIMGKVLTVQAKNPAEDFFALLDGVALVGSTTEHDNSSSSDIGGALLTYKVDYDYESPILPLVLEDFDWQGSIDNLIITNPGVPAND